MKPHSRSQCFWNGCPQHLRERGAAGFIELRKLKTKIPASFRILTPSNAAFRKNGLQTGFKTTGHWLTDLGQIGGF